MPNLPCACSHSMNGGIFKIWKFMPWCTVLLCSCSSTHSIAHSSRSQYAYGGRRCLSMMSYISKLHSRSLAVRHTCACDPEIVHTCYAISRLRTWVTQSPDCTHGLRNLQIAHMGYTISRLHTWVTQSPDSTHGLRNLQILHMGYAISRLCTCVTQSQDCANSQIARNINM